MTKRLALVIALGGLATLAAAAALIAMQSRRDVRDIYGMLDKYE